MFALKHTVGGTGECAGYDTRLAEERRAYAQLQFGGTALQAVHLLMPRLGASATLLAQFAYGLAYAPQLRIVGMGLKAPFVGERQHLVVDTCRIAYAQHGNATVDEFLRNPVDRHVALSAHQHLALTAQRLVYSLNQSGSLARSGRAVHDGNILGTHHLAHGVLLRGIEPWQYGGVECEV